MKSRFEGHHRKLSEKTEYTEYRINSGIPFNNRVKGRDNWNKFVDRYFDKVAERLLEEEAGIFVPRIGYFYIWRTPLVGSYLMFSKTANRLKKYFNFGVNKEIHFPMYFPTRSLFYYSMDKTFNKTFRQKLYKRLKKGQQYKAFPYTLKRLKFI